MDPRLPTSARWTALPSELVAQVQGIFTESFAKQLGDEAHLVVEGRIYPEELLLRVGVLGTGEIRQRNFEVSIDFNPAKENAVKQIHLAIDCAAAMMEAYFASRSENPWDDFPKLWQPFEVQGKTAFLQVSAVNSSLEAEADRLLGETDPGLIQGSDEIDRDAVITMLGLGDEDGDDPKDD